MVYLYAVVLTVLNLGFWIDMLLNLPGTWLMVLVTALLTWWQPGYVQVSWTVLGVALGVAVLGEVLECVLGVAGSRHAGGSKRAAGLAIVGSLVGGIIGTALPIRIVGTVIGACLGAFMGSLIGDLWAGGRSCELRSGSGVAGDRSGGRCPSSPSAPLSSSFRQWLRSSDVSGRGAVQSHAPFDFTPSHTDACLSSSPLVLP
jgi:uncharacterized protein YqgC (DUF456 family)